MPSSLRNLSKACWRSAWGVIPSMRTNRIPRSVQSAEATSSVFRHEENTILSHNQNLAHTRWFCLDNVAHLLSWPWFAAKSSTSALSFEETFFNSAPVATVASSCPTKSRAAVTSIQHGHVYEPSAAVGCSRILS